MWLLVSDEDLERCEDFARLDFDQLEGALDDIYLGSISIETRKELVLYSAGDEHVELELNRLQVLIVVINDGLGVELGQIFGVGGNLFRVIHLLLILAQLLLDDPLEEWVALHHCLRFFRWIAQVLAFSDLDRVLGHREH